MSFLQNTARVIFQTGRITTPISSMRLTSMTMASLRSFSTSSDQIRNGVVKWFDVKKGFGFIVPDDGSQDIFVHQSVIKAPGFRSLREGEPVEFLTEVDHNGKTRAGNVTGPGGVDVQGAPIRRLPDDGDFRYQS